MGVELVVAVRRGKHSRPLTVRKGSVLVHAHGEPFESCHIILQVKINYLVFELKLLIRMKEAYYPITKAEPNLTESKHRTEPNLTESNQIQTKLGQNKPERFRSDSVWSGSVTVKFGNQN